MKRAVGAGLVGEAEDERGRDEERGGEHVEQNVDAHRDHSRSDGRPSAVAARRISAMPPTMPIATAMPLSKPKMNGEAMKKPPMRYSRSPCSVAERSLAQHDG